MPGNDSAAHIGVVLRWCRSVAGVGGIVTRHLVGECLAIRSWRSQSSASVTIENVKNPVFFGMLTPF
ncbi:UNVERIFIED_CONTAM: lysine transporter LysE [Bifidobacterium breve]|nr:lysine transporter LysE [Bifidobacterium breve]